MGSLDNLGDHGDYLEAQLLTDPVAQAEDGSGLDTGRIIYRASFEELERSHVNYDTVQWLLISLVLILAYGVGLLMILYIPIRRYVVRKDIRSRKLYVTSTAVVYQVERPVFFPCFGVHRKEKHVLLHLVSDIVIEQGCLQSYYGLSSVRIETIGNGRAAPGDEVRLQGIANPKLFRQVVLMTAASLRQRGEGFLDRPYGDEMLPVDDVQLRNPAPSRPSHGWAWQPATAGVTSSWQLGSPAIDSISSTSSPKEAIYKKLEDVEKSLKRLEIMMGTRQQPAVDLSTPSLQQQLLPLETQIHLPISESHEPSSDH